MKRLVKWGALGFGILLLVAFLLFLYLIPPFTIAPPSAFTEPEAAAAPSLEHVADPAARLIAERGKYLVTSFGCAGCHVSTGAGGPNWDLYLAGGVQMTSVGYPRVVSRNLTPDAETGLGRRSDAEILRVLRSGVFHTGRIMHSRNMPWGAWSNLSEEDLRAIVLYLRNLTPVHHAIPDPGEIASPLDTAAVDEIQPGDHALP